MASEDLVHRVHSEGDSMGQKVTDGGPDTQKFPPGGNRGITRNFSTPGNFAKKQWRAAALKTRALPDPWAGHRLDAIPEEEVTRYMYNPRSGKWKTDEVVVKMQSEPFAHGAMRECYRMKKLSKFSQHPDWRNASNYVAKRYMKEVSRQMYFQDVKLQMDAKLWGEEYSKHGPPKKVDFFQTYIIEFKHREGCPLYCVEHLIEGEYIKYNSNSGFVSDMNRLTPHAFSHFTFERSRHQLIIVDIQGVGDLYTDPQMHTVDQKDYGEANLGTKGMALFFSSHICNPICMAMGLTQFDLSPGELDQLQNRRWSLSSATTAIHPSRSEPVMVGGRGGGGGGGRETTMGETFQRLSLTLGSGHRGSAGYIGYLPPDSPLESPGITMTMDRLASVSEAGEGDNEGSVNGGEEEEEEEEEDCDEDDAIEPSGPEGAGRYLGPPSGDGTYSASVVLERTRLREELGGGGGGGVGEGGGGSEEEEEENSLNTLGLIHLELALYHELGRFSHTQVPDLVSCWFHLEKAAQCGLPSALYTLAHVYLQQPHDSFKEISVEPSPAHSSAGMDYLTQAAARGHRAAMIELARALDSGEGLEEMAQNGPTDARHTRSWVEAAKWYSRALETPPDTSDTAGTGCQATEIANPDYIIIARLAEMYRSGGHQLKKDPNRAGEMYSQAAGVAMAAMKGKLANRYYMLAEEAWAEVEEEEEEEEEEGEEREREGVVAVKDKTN